MKRIVVIGAGAAGLMAAVIAAREGAEVILLEKMNMVGKKMGITGKGRCNITNAKSIEEIIANTPGNGRFLYSAYSQFSNEDLLSLVHQWGLQTKVERGGRVFPVSDSALEVRDMFRAQLKTNKAVLHLNEAAKEILHNGERIVGVQTEQHLYKADAVILCTGGMSYPLTGSNGDGYALAEKLGHTITELRPSLIPLELAEEWPKSLMGLSLKNVELSIVVDNKIRETQRGEFLFTHFGITGPLVLSLSHGVTKFLRKKKQTPIQIMINLKPALTAEALDKRLQRDFTMYSKKQLSNGMKDLLPQRLISVVIQQAGLREDMPINQITKEERQRLVEILQHLKVTVTKPRPLAEAIVTAGGLQLKEFNPTTMESKLLTGFFAAGEVLDIDAFTGGYNLQAAFSTGYVAAMHAVHGKGDE